MDEGVLKKSVVPVRQITNLIGSAVLGQSFDNCHQKAKKSFCGVVSPVSAENPRKMKNKVSFSNFEKARAVRSPKEAADKKKDLEDVLNSSCNEDVQNTPPKLKQKMYALASKNKFQNQGKPKAVIDLTIKGDVIVRTEKTQSTVYAAQGRYVLRESSVVLGDRRLDDHFRTHRAEKSDAQNLLTRKERLDSVLRKSTELLSALRTSADQIAQLKPINRAAIRLQSNERASSSKDAELKPSFLSRSPQFNKENVH